MPLEDDKEALPHISEDRAPRSVGFLISRLGFASSMHFTESLKPVGIDPREWALLRFVASAEGQSQQALGERTGIPASRMVAVVDGLEERGLVERRPDPEDRRVRALHLTAKGREVLDEAVKVAIRVETELCAELDEGERDQLIDLLLKLEPGPVSDRPGVHPALRTDPPG